MIADKWGDKEWPSWNRNRCNLACCRLPRSGALVWRYDGTKSGSIRMYSQVALSSASPGNMLHPMPLQSCEWIWFALRAVKSNQTNLWHPLAVLQGVFGEQCQKILFHSSSCFLHLQFSEGIQKKRDLRARCMLVYTTARSIENNSPDSCLSRDIAGWISRWHAEKTHDTSWHPGAGLRRRVTFIRESASAISIYQLNWVEGQAELHHHGTWPQSQLWPRPSHLQVLQKVLCNSFGQFWTPHILASYCIRWQLLYPHRKTWPWQFQPHPAPPPVLLPKRLAHSSAS